jgi:hypothetical protein
LESERERGKGGEIKREERKDKERGEREIRRVEKSVQECGRCL